MRSNDISDTNNEGQKDLAKEKLNFAKIMCVMGYAINIDSLTRANRLTYFIKPLIGLI